jgi:hypothetical protein
MMNILEAINNAYKEKEQQYLHVLSEMQSIAVEHLVTSNTDVGKAINQAMLTTIESLGKAFISIYKVEPKGEA